MDFVIRRHVYAGGFCAVMRVVVVGAPRHTPALYAVPFDPALVGYQGKSYRPKRGERPSQNYAYNRCRDFKRYLDDHQAWARRVFDLYSSANNGKMIDMYIDYVAARIACGRASLIDYFVMDAWADHARAGRGRAQWPSAS